MTRTGEHNPLLQRPTQAVILAGGRGTRLHPITQTCPKPMVLIHGKPFLEYLIIMLREQGFTHILLLLGYLPEIVQEYFGDGTQWGVHIDYSVTGADDLTAHRVKVAHALIDPCFLLMYCDNYWPMQMDKMWERFVSSGAPAMVTVYSNRDKYSKDSVIVDKDGFILVFDRSRTTPGLEGIEISYAILTKSVLNLLPEQDALFEDAIYPSLVKERRLLAYVSDHRYYSVGSLERLPLTETFFARHPTIFLDRDGVLNKKPPRAQYVRNWGEFDWVPGSKEALRLLTEAGYRIVIVSNQAGIGRGAMTEAALTQIHEQMKREIAEGGGRIDAIYYCPHDWEEGCQCRKPKPGMLFQAQRDLSLDLSRTLFIGDDERDAQAADLAGCPSHLLSNGQLLIDFTRQLLGTTQHKKEEC